MYHRLLLCFAALLVAAGVVCAQCPGGCGCGCPPHTAGYSAPYAYPQQSYAYTVPVAGGGCQGGSAALTYAYAAPRYAYTVPTPTPAPGGGCIGGSGGALTYPFRGQLGAGYPTAAMSFGSAIGSPTTAGGN